MITCFPLQGRARRRHPVARKSLPPVQQSLFGEIRAPTQPIFSLDLMLERLSADYEDSRQLIDSLWPMRPRPSIRNWQPGDLVIWDNRCLLHRGSGYDADKYRRRMRQSRVQVLVRPY